MYQFCAGISTPDIPNPTVTMSLSPYKVHKFCLPKKGKKRLIDLPKFLPAELSRYILDLKKR